MELTEYQTGDRRTDTADVISLRNVIAEDASTLCRDAFPALTQEQVLAMIAAWNTKQFQGRYFEMFAVLAEGEIVGTISLYQHTEDVISIGPEIFAPYRRHGYGTAAMQCACEIAKKKGYRLVSQQVRVNNTASIAMHASLGFETDGEITTNAKGNQIVIYQKNLD